MGNEASKSKGAARSAAPSPGPSTPKVAESVTFVVEPLSIGVDSPPSYVALRIDPEAMVMLDARSQAVLQTFSYYKIISWGSSLSTFQWRASTDSSDEASYATYSVLTDNGAEVESALLDAIQRLMGRMALRGVPDALFTQLLATLQLLSDEGHSEHALQAVRQMALGREFDVKQAVVLVNLIGTVSPFDKVEAAVALFPCLMSLQSYGVLLTSCFEDAGDRDNVCHRLGLTIGGAGKVQLHPAGEGAKRLAARDAAAAAAAASAGSGGAGGS